MNIRVQTQGFALTPAISAWTGSRLSRVLKPFADEVLQVEAFLKDLNGPKGGEDKQALVCVRVRNGAPVVAESTHSDLYAAIDQSARTARRSVRRQREKRVSLERAPVRTRASAETLFAEA